MASKRHVRRKACEAKRWYATESEARQAAARMRAKKAETLEAYRCPLGGTNHWHVGHPRMTAEAARWKP